MKFLVALTLAVAIAPATAFGQTTWTIDPNHTLSSFSVRHLLISTVHGEFGKTAGTFRIDDKDIAKSNVDATIDVTSLDTRVPDRDKHLKSADFFDAEKHPTMVFKSTKVEKIGKDRLKVTGDLVIRGTTRPAVLDVTYSAPIKGMEGETRRGFTATTKINRKEFGLNWSKAVEAGPVVGDEVNIMLDVEAIKDEPKAERK
ncbi:MAG TPA: YceI family protein [Propionicimonas sp.]|jgi:polyisoprenoid-binding protein YceI